MQSVLRVVLDELRGPHWVPQDDQTSFLRCAVASPHFVILATKLRNSRRRISSPGIPTCAFAHVGPDAGPSFDHAGDCVEGRPGPRRAREDVHVVQIGDEGLPRLQCGIGFR